MTPEFLKALEWYRRPNPLFHRLTQKGKSMNQCSTPLRSADLAGAAHGVISKEQIRGLGMQADCAREQTVAEHFDYQINRALETIEQLRNKKKNLEDRGFAQMSISAYERQFGLYVNGPF